MKQIENQSDGEIFDALTHSPETKKIIDHYIYRYGDRVIGRAQARFREDVLDSDPQKLSLQRLTLKN